MKPKAVIYDMDGLLVDSMIHWLKWDQKFFASRGDELTDEVVKFLSGRSLEENVVWLKEKFGWEESVEELIKMRTEATNKVYTHHCKVMPGVDDLIKEVAAHGIKQAIASASPLYRVEITRKRFGWEEHLTELVASDHVDFKGKPDPAIFLLASERLGIDPKDCVVLEDAENGVVAAKRAGMQCVAVPDSRWSHGDFSIADLVVDSLGNERVYKFLGLK